MRERESERGYLVIDHYFRLFDYSFVVILSYETLCHTYHHIAQIIYTTRQLSTLYTLLLRVANASIRCDSHPLEIK